MNIEQLRRDHQTAHDAAMALVQRTAATCQTEDRQMTAEERRAVEEAGATAAAARDRVTQAEADAHLFANIGGLVPRQVGSGMTAAARQSAPPAQISRLTLGQQFSRSDAYEFIRRREHRSSSAWRSPVAELPFPASFTSMFAATLTEDPASGGTLVLPQYLPGIRPLGLRRLVVAGLMPNGTTDSNLISYMMEKTFTNTAAPVLEGAAKPESTLTFEAKTAPVRKLAHWLPVTEEMLEDQPQIESYIDARLTLGLQLAEEDQLLNGTGVAPQLQGFLTHPNLGATWARVDPATNADALATQFFKLYGSSYLTPDGFVMNPANWATTLLAKTSTGEYMAGGPYNTSLLQSTLWGLPVAVTPGIAAGTALVGAFQSGAQIFRHGGIRVESSNSHQDFFIKNLVAIRCEERLALAIYRPGAFGTVTALT
jgi:HK97 family phage major capsid protein